MLTQVWTAIKPMGGRKGKMPPKNLDIQITPSAENVMVTLSGEATFDFDKSAENIEAILGHKAKEVVVDAGALTFITSIGICFLINLRKGVQAEGGKLQVTKLQPMVRKALEHAHVLHLFEVTA